ncbi:MAG: NAD(P)-dependent oxidoreductase [Dehalococcoidales bacterium]|nr:NAD(P)-dependent oxidoreductase [Dehalococcoidales bacterium]
MRVLVIGGSGLFGRKTVSCLLKDPDVEKVVSMDINPPKDWFTKSIQRYAGKFTFVRGDVSKIEDILNAMKDYSIDKLVNWAFIMGPAVNANPRLSTNINALGMCNAFEAARLMDVKRVVFASSETVYGPQAMYGDREVTEDDQTNPTHSYAVCKLFAEILAGQYSQIAGMNFTALRPTIGYGHGGQSPAQLWSDMPSFAATGKPFATDGDGKGLMSLVSADDLGEFTRILIKAPSSPHPVYNVGGPPASPGDLAAVIKKYLPEAKITFGEKATLSDGKTGLPWKVSMQRAKEDFNFTLMPIDESVKIHINDARLEAGLPLMEFN